jgi:hypothetical protein
MISIETGALIGQRYSRLCRQPKPGDPERKLMFGVLMDAIQTYQKFAGSKSFRGKALYREEEAWFWSENYEPAFSFANICQVFGLNPAFFRWRLRQLTIIHKRRVSRGKVFQLRPVANRPRRLTFSGQRGGRCFSLGRERPGA